MYYLYSHLHLNVLLNVLLKHTIIFYKLKQLLRVSSSFDSVRSNRLWVITGNDFIRTFQKSSVTPLDGKMDNSYNSNSSSGCYLPCLIIKWVVII